MDANSYLGKSSYHTKSKPERKERYFELVLPAMVTGLNAKGEEFNEKTKIASINAQEASFWLANEVTAGTKLHVGLEIPKTLILEAHLILSVSGEVAHIQNGFNPGKKQLVTIQLDNSFNIHPAP